MVEQAQLIYTNRRFVLEVVYHRGGLYKEEYLIFTI